MVKISFLHRAFAWDRVIPRLNNDRSAAAVYGALPAIVNCPLCSKRQLKVYHDPVWEGQWVVCGACDFHGDIIELALRHYGNDIQTNRRMASLVDTLPMGVLEEALEEHQEKTLKPRRAAAEFWEMCKHKYAAASSPNLRELQRRIGASGGLGALWAGQGGQVLGACNKQDVAQLAPPGRIKLTKLFPGKGWDDLLVVPHWRLPGLLSGFAFFGRGLNPATDYVFQHAGEALNAARPGSPAEAGVGMLPAVNVGEHPALGRTLFVTNDPLMALRLHLRHMKSSLSLLPLITVQADIGAQSVTSPNMWSWIGKDRLLFWAPEPSLALINHARAAGAKVSVYEVPPHRLHEKSMRQEAPHVWLHKAKQRAVSWDEALRSYLEHLRPAAIADAVLSLNLSGPELREFIANAPTKLGHTLADIYTSKARARQVRLGRHVVTEEADGWRTDGLQIANCVVRVEQLLQSSEGRCHYRGVIIYDGQTVPFTDEVKNIKPNLLSWAQDRLLLAGYGGMHYVNSWGPRSLNLALAFNKPETVMGVDVVGWDQDRCQFNFPKFAIRVGGVTLDDYACVFAGSRVPCGVFNPPSTITRKEAAAFSARNDETAVFWAMAGYVASEALASAMHCSRRGLVLAGHGAQSVGRGAAERLGCPCVDPRVGSGTIAQGVQKAEEECGKHKWPYMLQLGSPSSLPVGWFDKPKTHTILAGGWALASVLGMRGWSVLRCHRKLGVLRLPGAAASRIMPAYLLDLCKRQLYVTQQADSHLENILCDLASWWKTCHDGDEFAVLDALKLLDPGETTSPGRHFMDAVFHLIADGRLRMARKAFDDKADGRTVICDIGAKPTVWIPERRVVDLIESLAGSPPDVLAATESMESDGGLVGRRLYGAEPGWLVGEDWWADQHEDWKARNPWE